MLHLPRLYDELAGWMPLLSPPEDHAEEAERYRDLLVAECAPRKPRTLLELGSGGGNNASFLKKHLELTLVDASAAMLEVSRKLNPECEHRLGDIRTVRLGREFDAVFVHDAVAYLTDETALRLALETAFVHCTHGGAALFAPDFVRETFRPGVSCGGRDLDGRSLRFLEWTHESTESTYRVDFALLVCDRDGVMRCEFDRHQCGLFSRAEWLRYLGEAGFEARVVRLEFATATTHEMFVGKRQC